MHTKPDNRKLKTIDLTQKRFTANGKEYFIETAISYERYLMYTKLQIEAGYEVGFEELYKHIKKIYELCNQMKFADIAVLCHNILTGIKGIENRKIPVMQLCALFINTEDEDRKVINDDMVDKKLADWEAEGLDVAPFFAVAIASIRGFSSAYEDLSLGILDQKVKTDLSNILNLSKEKQNKKTSK